MTRWMSPGLSGAAIVNLELFFGAPCSGVLSDDGSSVCVKIL